MCIRDRNNNAIAIIGGADGPTSVFVAGKLNSVLVSILLIAIILSLIHI